MIIISKNIIIIFFKITFIINKTVKLGEKEICNKWLLNKNINPETSRKIKETGTIYKKLSKKCLNNNSITSKLNSIKIKACKKIHKLFIPYINRTTANIIDCINYFLIIKKISYDNKTKNNIDENNNPIYSIENRIILDKIIEPESSYSISYGYLKCNNNNKELFSYLKIDNKTLLIQINELEKVKTKDNLNAITQILLSIIFFHNYTNFLYHKIKSGGYFHYNIYGIDYYLKNNGYLWVITDFTNVLLYKIYMQKFYYDLEMILNYIKCLKQYFSNNEFKIISKLYNILVNITDTLNNPYAINKEILNYLQLKNHQIL